MSINDNKLFKAMGSATRLRMLDLLGEDDMHISALARELDVSIPVAAKHVKVLEDVELVERKIFGKTHILSLNSKNIHKAMDRFAPVRRVEVEKGTTLLEALKNVSAVEVKKLGDKEAVVATDGEEGLYVYEVDGNFSDKPVQDYVFDENATVEWKKLEPVTKKKLIISVKE